MIFIGEKELYNKLDIAGGISYKNILEQSEWNSFLEAVSEGESFIFIGMSGLERLKELWIDTYEEEPFAYLTFNNRNPMRNTKLDNVNHVKGKCRYVYLRPEKTYLCHGIDEEIRANIYPIAEAAGRYGNVIGYPAVMIRNYANSLVKGRFKGSSWYVFLFENPEEIMSIEDWKLTLRSIMDYDSEKCYISRLRTEYPLYLKDEKVKLECTATNLRKEIESTIVRFEVIDENGTPIKEIGEVERCLNVNEEMCISYDWYPEAGSNLYRIRASLYKQDRFRYGLARESNAVWIDAEEYMVLIKDDHQEEQFFSIEGSKIDIQGKSGFFLGTNYFPSSSFYDWTYRDLRVDKVYADIVNMKMHGIKVVRIFADPVLDEEALRGLDACLELCERNGITIILTIFTSWTRWLEINIKNNKSKKEVMDFKNDALVGVYLHNMEFQTDYVTVLAERFKNKKNFIWDITNEFGIVDPDNSQLDPSWMKHADRNLSSPYKNTEIFRQWVNKMEDAIKSTGASQLIIKGMAFDTGVDNYLSTKDADIISWHTYEPVITSAKTTLYNNVSCINKPLIVEEFGSRRNGCDVLQEGVFTGEVNPEISDKKYLEKRYEEQLHYFLGTGAAGACSYEWGVSWLTRHLPYTSPPRKYNNEIAREKLDIHAQIGMYDYSKTWPQGSIGICPWAASFEFGMNYSCIPCSSPTLKLFKKYAYAWSDLDFHPQSHKVYLVIPIEFSDFLPNEGYKRKTEVLFKAIEKLWKNGIVFGVWQEDELDHFNIKDAIIIFPNENKIKPETGYELEKLTKNGVRVYKGQDFSWDEDNDLERVPFTAPCDIHLLVREGNNSRTYIMRNLQKELHAVKLKCSNADIEIQVKSFGLLQVKRENIVMAESEGKVLIGDQLISDSGGIKYIIKSLGEEDLRYADKILVIAYGPLKLKVDRRFRTAKVLGDRGQTLDTIMPEPLADSNLFEIDGHMADFFIELSN